MQDMEMIDVSDNVKKKKDKFMIGIYISLIVLVVLGLVTYFFGYELLKPFIEV
jgi:hypothetical protein